jgi:hypothetical protein
MALPGWYSLSSVVEIHVTLEGIAVAFFVALVVFDVLAHLKKNRETLFERIALFCFGIAVLTEVCAYPYSRRIDTLSKEADAATEGKIAALNKEAGDARQQAGESDERAGKALERASKADERAAKNEKEAARLKKEAERLHGENLILQTDVLKLRQRMADRHLTPKQQSAITNKLCPQFGGLNLTIGLYSADGEMNALAADIDGALPLLCPNNRIGWAVSISPGQTPVGFSGSRIFVYEGASFRVRLFASALFEALKSEGLQVEGPMPRPNFGGMISGGGRVRTFNTGVLGTEAGTFVEIGIGRKP